MIVVGYTAGAYGRACLEEGIAQARLRDTELLVISAVSEARGQRMVDAAEIAWVQRELAATGLRWKLSQPIGGTPAEELLGAMADPAAEILVIGMRRRTQVGKLLLGSTSQYLLVECRKPVLVVKPTDEHRRPPSDLSPVDEAGELPYSGTEIEP